MAGYYMCWGIAALDSKTKKTPPPFLPIFR